MFSSPELASLRTFNRALSRTFSTRPENSGKLQKKGEITVLPPASYVYDVIKLCSVLGTGQQLKSMHTVCK